MISVIEHIEYLMMSNDCVVIPGWGALLAQYTSSFVSNSDSMIEKPQRTLGFNAQINHSDGLLAQSIMRREGMNYNQAMQVISDNVMSFRTIINNGGEVPFGKLGFFSRNEQGQAVFVPFFNKCRNDEYFGLRSFEFKTLADLRKLEEPAEMLQDNNEETTVTRHNPFARKWIQVAASIAILIGLVTVLSTPIPFDSEQSGRNFASLQVPSVKTQQQQRHDVVETEPNANATTDVYKPAQVMSQSESLGEYFLVVSTFRTQAKAQAFINENPDLKNARILSTGKIHKVYIATGNDRDQLAAVAKTLPQKYQGVWISK